MESRWKFIIKKMKVFKASILDDKSRSDWSQRVGKFETHTPFSLFFYKLIYQMVLTLKLLP